MKQTYAGHSTTWLSELLYCPGGSQVFSLIPLRPPSKTPRAWLQPEELTLLLVQLRRHQAKMAGVQSPSDAFTHLQHHQHNDLLGPSMQVRGRSTSVTSSTTHCNPSCQCIVAPHPLPSQSHTILPCHSWDCVVCLALLGCLVYSTTLAWVALHTGLPTLLWSYKVSHSPFSKSYQTFTLFYLYICNN